MQHDDVLALAWAALICLAVGGTAAALAFPLVFLGCGAVLALVDGIAKGLANRRRRR